VANQFDAFKRNTQEYRNRQAYQSLYRRTLFVRTWTDEKTGLTGREEYFPTASELDQGFPGMVTDENMTMVKNLWFEAQADDAIYLNMKAKIPFIFRLFAADRYRFRLLPNEAKT